MKDKVRILTCCTYYEDIIKFDCLDDDFFSKKMIKIYQEYIFHIDDDEQNLIVVKKLDNAMYKYITDFYFAKSFRETLDIDTVMNPNFTEKIGLLKYLISFYEKYSDESIKKTSTRWI